MAVAEPEVGSSGQDLVRRASGADVLDPHVPRLAAGWSATGAGRVRVVDGTLVFADISGFTALSERLAAQGPIGAEELTDVLGRCFAELLAVAYAGGGSLVKFGGDALLLLFDGPHHERRGVDAALAMRTTMARMGQLSTSAGRVRLRMSLGIHSGPIHAVRVGASHQELLLVGPGASTVVTMEGAADAGEIVVSPATAGRIDASLLADAKGPGLLLRRHARARVLPEAPADGSVTRVDEDVVASVPVALREHLSAGGGESEHRPATVAFLNFDATDDLVAEHGDEAMADAVEVLVADVQRACATHGVTFLGSDLGHDGGKLILVAGVPRVLGDDEGRMLRAVHEIVSAARAIPVRIGVNRGRVFAGEVGPPYRRTFTVMGDAVNLAARLMAKAEPGEVLVSRDVLGRSRTAFATTPLPPFFVKGKRNPVEAFALGEPAGTREIRRSGRLPMTGREEELGRLRRWWAEARDGQGGAVIVQGEVGVGKTRLVEELRTGALADGAEVRLVQCEQYEAATPFFAVRLLVRAVLGDTAALMDRVESVAPHLARWAPLVGDVVGVVLPETAETRPLEPRFRRERTGAVVAELLHVLIDRPALLVFDDVHWIDDASSHLLRQLAARAPGRPWLLVATRRRGPEGLAADSLPTARLVEVQPLSDPDADRLVAAATAAAPLRPERRRAIVERAQGNPLFLEELVTLDAGDDLPDTLEAILALQLDRLPVTAGRVLRTAAVLGTSFDVALLAEVAGVPDVEGIVDHELADLLVREADGRRRFRHRLLRDVAYSLLPFRRRRQLHGWAADAIEAAASDPDERAAVLSLHCLHAQRYETCLRHARVAGDRARRRYALVEARELYERALEAGRRADRAPAPRRLATLWLRLAMTCHLQGDYPAAEAAYAQVRRLRPDDPLLQARLALRSVDLAERRGDAAAAGRWIARGLRAIDGLETPAAQIEEAFLLIARSGLRYHQGDLKGALRWARRAVRIAEASGGREVAANAYTMLDTVYVSVGRLDLATNGTKALAVYRRLRKRDSLATLLNNLGAFAYYQGRWSEALRLYEEARRNFEKVGNLVDAALGSSNIAEIFADQGRLEDAERLLGEVIETWRSLSFPLGTARATRYLARVHLRRGHAELGLAHFEAARGTFDEYGLVANVHEVDVWRAECLLRLGRGDEARALLDVALALEISSAGTDLRPMVHRLRAALAASERRIDDAWAEADESLHHARSRGAPFDVALALETMAVLARLGGRPVGEDARREREQLLSSLGVVASPPPLIEVSASRD